MSVDESFYKHLLVVIRSAVFHSKSHIHLYLCVRDEASSRFFSEKLAQIVSVGFSFEIIIFNSFALLEVFKGKFFDHPIECYFRILLGSILPVHIKKIIYLDADMIVNSDLGELYNQKIEKTIGGVIDRFGHNYCKKYILDTLNIQLNHYINAGMLLINLERWRSADIEYQMITFLNSNFYKLKMLDQDLINIFFQDDMILLHEKWNHFLFHGQYNLSIKGKTGIYHLIGIRKGDSLMYPNYTIKKKYQFFSGESQYASRDMWHILIYVFISLPLSKFLIQKSILHYKGEQMKAQNFIYFLLIFYPPVLFVVLKEAGDMMRKKGVLFLLQRVMEFFK